MKEELNDIQNALNVIINEMKYDTSIDSKLTGWAEQNISTGFILLFRALSKKNNRDFYNRNENKRDRISKY